MEFLFFITVVFLVAVITGYSRHEVEHNKIRKFFSKNDWKVVKIKWVPRTFRSDLTTFEVIFIDTDNTIKRVRCKVSPRESDVFLGTKTTLREITREEQEKMLNRYLPTIEELQSTKEKLLNQLSSNYSYERKVAAENAAMCTELNETIIHRLKEMATTDEADYVRKAASRALQNIEGNHRDQELSGH